MYRSPFSRQSYEAADTMLAVVQRFPGGPTWLGGLPMVGRYSFRTLRRHLAAKFHTAAFNQQTLRVFLTAALDSTGKPDERGVELYNWLLSTYYRGDVKALYKDWWLLTQQGKST